MNEYKTYYIECKKTLPLGAGYFTSIEKVTAKSEQDALLQYLYSHEMEVNDENLSRLEIVDEHSFLISQLQGSIRIDDKRIRYLECFFNRVRLVSGLAFGFSVVALVLSIASFLISLCF